jgi:hypothetical protein
MIEIGLVANLYEIVRQVCNPLGREWPVTDFLSQARKILCLVPEIMQPWSFVID